MWQLDMESSFSLTAWSNPHRGERRTGKGRLELLSTGPGTGMVLAAMVVAASFLLFTLGPLILVNTLS